MLAGEPVRFDANLTPQYTANQIEHSAAATRTGLTKWAATPHGRRFIKYFAANDCDITVIEDTSENAMGRAPEPGIAMMVAKRRNFIMVLNPAFYRIPNGMAPLPGEPANASEAMAVAWGGEMLHIYFYAHGISLPHHHRDDFQEHWVAIAGELGMTAVRHADGDELARSAIVRTIGR